MVGEKPVKTTQAGVSLMISTKVIYVTNVPKTSASGKGSTATGVPIQHLFCKSKLSHSKNFI